MRNSGRGIMAMNTIQMISEHDDLESKSQLS